MFKHSIKTNILTIFLLLLSIISLSILSSQYYFNQILVVSATDKTFNLITKNLTQHIKHNNIRISNILESNLKNNNIYNPIYFHTQHSSIHDLIKIMTKYKGIHSLYFAHKDGSYYEVVNMQKSQEFCKLSKIPKKTRWTNIISINGTTKYSFLDQNINLISSYTIKKEYNPLLRPWYLSAIKSDNSIMTEPYKFANFDLDGITYAVELEQKGTVLAIDYTLRTLHKFLKLQKFDEKSEIFLFNKEGDKVASSDKNFTSITKIDSQLKHAFSENNTNIIKYAHDEKYFFSFYSNIEQSTLTLGIKVDKHNLLKPYNETIKHSLIIALSLLLLSLPIIFLAVKSIVKPIQALIIENQKIKNRNFSKVSHIQTNIIEFIELSHSFVLMSQSIQEYQKSQEELLNALIKLIAEAVDTKSPYTGGHCRRVPEIAQLLVYEANKSSEGVFKEFKLESEDDLREFEIGAWLHDCGKVTTPEYVVDKSTKLETINDRIHEVRTRFEVLWRDAQITYLEAKLNGNDIQDALGTLNATQEQLLADFEFVANANIGGEYMSPDKQEHIQEIASQEWIRNFDDSLGLGEVEILRYDKENAQTLPATEKLLSDKSQHIIKRENFDYEAYEKDGFKEEVPEYLYNYGEVYNLCIAKGTLSPEERYKINEHVIMTIKMLEKVPFPSQMTKIPEYAGTHHETLIGTGYPRKLSADELSIPARIMALADVFEALTASDRPYKKAKTLSASVKILSFMVKDKHLDEDVFKLFLRSDLHNVYAARYLKPEQIDEVDIEQYL